VVATAMKYRHGNDQIRFDLIFQTIAPEIEIIIPSEI
jgi:argininosuccinate synthase